MGVAGHAEWLAHITVKEDFYVMTHNHTLNFLEEPRLRGSIPSTQ
jgi:hypothetical protein